MCKENGNKSWNPSICTCENTMYLKSIVDSSVIVCDEIISIKDTVSRNAANTISTNVTSTMLIKSDDKKVRYKMGCYVLHSFLLVAILLFLIIMQNIKIETLK